MVKYTFFTFSLLRKSANRPLVFAVDPEVSQGESSFWTEPLVVPGLGLLAADGSHLTSLWVLCSVEQSFLTQGHNSPWGRSASKDWSM